VITDRKRIQLALRFLLVQFAVFSAIWAEASNASDVFKWIDDDGVVHYSDSRPADDVLVTTVQVREHNSKDYSPATDPYSIINQAKRVNESWRERIEARQQALPRSGKARRDSRYTAPPYVPFTYYRATTFYPVVVPLRERRGSPGAARRQLSALNALVLAGQRPESINSGVHRERVRRSQALPIVKPGAGSSFVIAP
jgi:hypothetical protein